MTKDIIHALHHQTDQLLGFLTNDGDKLFWDDQYVHDLSGEHIFNFTMSSKIAEAQYFDERARFLIPSEDVGFEEFIVFESHTVDDEKYIFGNASYSDMEKQFILEAGKYTGTVKELAALVLPETEWQAGELEYSGIRTIELESAVGAYSFLKRIATAFDVELRFRVETQGNTIAGRFVDVLERIGLDDKKEIVLGKDLISIEKKVNSERIVTALYCIGPEREDGTRLTAIVQDEDAYQRWNRNGKHLVAIYEPQSSNQEMTPEQLQQYGRTELEKRIASIVDYIITAASLETLYPHEKVRIGDKLRIKDPEFSPPLYADARAIRIERSLTDVAAKTYKIGEVVTYTEDEIMATFRLLQKFYGTRVIKSSTPPPGDPKIIWIKTDEGSDFEIAHTWNGSEWIAITPTRADQIGAETPEGAQEKADDAKEQAKEYAESRAEWERLQGHAVQLLTEKAGYEQQYNEAYNAPTLYTPAIKSALLAAWNEYLSKFNALYNAINAASADEAITQMERDDIELKTIAYRAAVSNFNAKHAAALRDIGAGMAKDAEEAATDYFEDYGQKKITQGLVAPSNPVTGDLWIDTSLDPYQWKQWNGTEWKILDRTNLSEFDGQIIADQIANGAVEAAKIKDGAVTGAKILDLAITAPKIGNLAIEASKIAPNAVTTEKLVDNAITTIKLGNLAVDASKIAVGAVTSDKVVDGAISTIKIGNLAVDATKLANNAVTTAKILDGAIADAKIAAGAVTSGKIFDGAITNTKLAALAVDAAKLASGAVTDIKLATGAVTNEKLAALAVDAAKLADSSVTATKIASLAVGTAAIANGAITTAKIGNAQITSALIGDAQITAAKIAALAVGTAAIQDAAITNAKVGALDASKITTGRLDAARVQIGTGTEFAAGYDPTLISVGGRNLVLNSTFNYGDWSGSSYTTRLTPEEDKPNSAITRILATQTGSAIASPLYNPKRQKVNLPAGTQLTISFDMKVPSAEVAPTSTVFTLRKSNAASGGTVTSLQSLSVGGSLGGYTEYGTWRRVSAVVTLTQPVVDEWLIFGLYVAISSVGRTLEMYYREVQVEVGNKATDWTPAPEDNPALLWQFADTTFIDGGKIYANSVTANQIAAGTLTANEIGANAINATQIATNAITTDKINANAVTTAKINTGAVTASEIAANAITAIKILSGSVETDKLAANAVTAVKIATGTITAAQIAGLAISGDKIAANAISAAKISAGTITATELATNSVTTLKIATGAVTANEIATNAITAVKVAAGAIETDKLGANAVTADKIASNSITAAEIATNAITADELAANAVKAVNIEANAITADKLAANSITAGKIAANGVVAENIAAGAITASKLAIASQNLLWDVDTFEQYVDGSVAFGAAGSSVNTVTSETDSPFGKNTLKHVSTGTNSSFYPNPSINTSSGWARIAIGKRYILSAYVKTTSATAVTLQLVSVPREFNSGTSSSGATTGSISLSAADGWKRISVLTSVIGGTNPALAYYIRSLTSGITTYWDGFMLEEYNGVDAAPSPFVPGGSVYIHGGNVAANSITATQIAANTITASEIASNTITSNLIATAGLDAGVIKFGTMSGSRIQANSVTATQLAAGTITATEIASNAITSAKIAANAVTADKINVTTLSALTANLGTVTAGSLIGTYIESGSTGSNKVFMDSGTFFSVLDTGTTASKQMRLFEDRIIFSSGSGNIWTGDGITYRSSIEPQTNNTIRLTNATGHLEVGALNSSFLHLNTDRPAFYFYKPTTVNGLLTTAGVTSSGAITANGGLNMNDNAISGFQQLTGRHLGRQILADSNNGQVLLSAVGTSLVLGWTNTSVIVGNQHIEMSAGKYLYTNAVDINPRDSGANIYLRPSATGEARVTATGTTGTYRPIVASAFNNGSSRTYKTNIEELSFVAIDEIDKLKVWEYDLIADLEAGITNNRQIGLISEDSPIVSTPDEKAINNYKLLSLNVKATQELHQIIKSLQEEIVELKARVA